MQAGQLSGGEQMILSIARALVLRPRFLLFDEPSAGLSPKLVGDVLVRAAELAQRGVGVIMIEQNIREALRVADRMYVLVAGPESVRRHTRRRGGRPRAHAPLSRGSLNDARLGPLPARATREE